MQKYMYNMVCMKVGIYYNAAQAEPSDSERLARILTDRGCEVQLFDDTEAVCSVDRLVVLGGDGTVLRAAKRAAELRIPLVGVNYGRLGFLTEFERGETEAAAKLVLDGNAALIRRSMLEVDLNGRRTYCLNELALLRGVSEERDNRVARISAVIDGGSAGDFYADGLIVATPTGSTAYSLSAGGNIMTPECATFLLTPICAFSMRSRPIAYSDDSDLLLRLEGDRMIAYGDGVSLGTVGRDDVLTVRKAERSALFLTRDRHSFFRRLTQKLN